MPPASAVEAAWQVLGVEQTGQLARANARTSDVIGIVTNCEARDAAAVGRVARLWWR